MVTLLSLANPCRRLLIHIKDPIVNVRIKTQSSPLLCAAINQATFILKFNAVYLIHIYFESVEKKTVVTLFSDAASSVKEYCQI